MKQVWAYDVETILNCFTVTFISIKDEKDHRQFVISNALKPLGVDKFYSGYKELCKFINEEVKGLISFNGVNFDAPILSDILRNGDEYTAYQLGQRIVGGDKVKGTVQGIRELDLFLLYHFNNESRRTSLKWVQCHLGMENIQEMPHPHDQPVTNLKQLQEILDYNRNDVIATIRFFHHKKTQGLIAVRKWAKATYGIECLNASNAHMGEMIFLKQMGNIPTPDTKKQTISIGDLILPQIKFKTQQFQKILDWFRTVEFSSLEEGKRPGRKIMFDGMKYEFGFGGLHAARDNSHWKDVDSLDVKSFYPNLAIKYKFRPAHLGEQFSTVYERLYQQRMATTSPVANNALKEALNSVFGKSNSIYSPLYDPKMMYSITTNGQLLMAMLAEKMTLNGAGNVIMVNTDGMEIQVKDREQYDKTLNEWKAYTGMPVSVSKYKKLMIRDVNNYIGLTYTGSVKSKGAFVVDQDWHKDPSMRIVTKAVEEWFVKGTPIGESILTFPTSDFFMYKRSKTGKMVLLDNYGVEIEAPKTIRYLVTKVGYVLIQETEKIRSKIHSDGYVTVMNNLFEAIEDNQINLEWYIIEAKKLIVPQQTPQLFS